MLGTTPPDQSPARCSTIGRVDGTGLNPPAPPGPDVGWAINVGEKRVHDSAKKAEHESRSMGEPPFVRFYPTRIRRRTPRIAGGREFGVATRADRFDDS